MAGDTASIPITLGNGCDYVTIASMAINTNDCFVAINGERVQLRGMPRPLPDSQEFILPGLDAGSEENNELCSSIPGPACGSGLNARSGNGEGRVHVHRGRGLLGVNKGRLLSSEDLSVRGVSGTPLEAGCYDLRNPMARVVIGEIIN